MERFIDYADFVYKFNGKYLKSSMERFIVLDTMMYVIRLVI